MNFFRISLSLFLIWFWLCVFFLPCTIQLHKVVLQTLNLKSKINFPPFSFQWNPCDWVYIQMPQVYLHLMLQKRMKNEQSKPITHFNSPCNDCQRWWSICELRLRLLIGSSLRRVYYECDFWGKENIKNSNNDARSVANVSINTWYPSSSFYAYLRAQWTLLCDAKLTWNENKKRKKIEKLKNQNKSRSFYWIEHTRIFL